MMNNMDEAKSVIMTDTLSKFIWHYMKSRKIFIAGMIFVGVAWCTEMVTKPYLLKSIIDTANTGANVIANPMHTVGFFCVIYVIMTAVGVCVTNFYMFLSLKLYPKLSADIVKDMYLYLINHSFSFFQSNFTGGLTKKIFDMSSNVERLIRIANEQFFIGALRLTVSALILFYVVHPAFSAVLVLWALVFIYLTYVLSLKSQEYSRELSEADVGVGSVLSDSITNIVSIKLFSGIDSEMKQVDHKLDAYIKGNQKLQLYTMQINVFQGVGVIILIGLMLALLMHYRTLGKISIGDFALVIMLTTTLVEGVYMIGRQLVEFSKVVGVCNQALSIMRAPHEIVDVPNAKDLIVTDGQIQFNDVKFSYSKKKPVFNKLNLLIHPCEKIGLVGLSGGGKSTLVKLLLRLYDLQEGNISIDGQDIKQIKKDTLHNSIAAIPQEPELFHRTVLENIRFARPGASDEQVYQAAKKAHCDEFINELPERYQSLVGERGIKLSGGQRQRIAIARAVLKNAPILVLDEATSALDSLTEKHIQEALDEAMQGKTVIVIAHRLSTLKSMNRILVFENGCIVEDGSPKELLKNTDGKFSMFWKMQSEGFIQTFEGGDDKRK